MSAPASSERIPFFFPPSAVRVPANASGITVSMGQVEPGLRRLAAARLKSHGGTRKKRLRLGWVTGRAARLGLSASPRPLCGSVLACA